MARTVRNNPPCTQPREYNRHRSRESNHASRSPRGPSQQHSTAGRQRATDAFTNASESLNAAPDTTQADALAEPNQRRTRRARHLFRNVTQEALRNYQEQEQDRGQNQSLEPRRNAQDTRRGRRHQRPEPRRAAAAWFEQTTRQIAAAESSSFEVARTEYITSIDTDVMLNMHDTVVAVRKVLEEVMQRSDEGPGLVPEDIALLMGRGVYATPAIALVNVLPTLCKRHGHSCGLSLFEERHMTANPTRQQRVMSRVFDACAQLCNTRDTKVLEIEIRACIPALVQHIDEDTQPEGARLQGVWREVLYAVREVRGTLLTAVLRAASDGLESSSDSEGG